MMGRGPGIRLYFCRQGNRLVLLSTAGDKSTQQLSDIARARRLLELYA